ncbi:C-C chemokine receptor type 6 [Larimichthys crocea]|uniref:C-C chemokine receptor type 6 n=1 Tax=Larimichthys crocea TaxID=215358 RepID=A0A6G0IE17_LARCR|nr:C-C chemokine receptor type 6 [Larimichthys crocea]
MDSSTVDYDYNTEDYPDDGFCNFSPDPMEVITQTYIHSIICAFGLIGNALVIITYIFYKRTKTMTDVFLFNVAVADLIFVVALPFIIYNEQHNWLQGPVVCKMLRSVYSINLYSGMLLLACISVFLTLPTLIYTEISEDMNLGSSKPVTMCQLTFNKTETAKLMKVLVPSLQMAIGFLLPLLMMVFCYSSILCTLLRAQSNNQRHKAIRVVLAVVVVFIMCHLPYNAALLNHTMSLFKERSCEAEQIKLRVLAISRSIAYLHCCLNPILYAFIGVKFRSHFRQIMLDLWCFSKKYIYSVRTSRATSDVCVSVHVSSEVSNHMSSFTA